MKQKFIFGVLAVLLVGLSSCTLEKRHYRNGFYFDLPGNAHDQAVRVETAPAESENSPRHNGEETVAAIDTNREVEIIQEATQPILATDISVHIPSIGKETPVEDSENAERKNASLPLEKDRKQAIGAGVAAALFFVLGMVGLIIKGTAPPTGVFIGAAFLCCILCIVLASFLYPREPEIKQAKEEPSAPAGKNGGIAAIGIGLLLATLGILLIFAYLLLELMFGLLF